MALRMASDELCMQYGLSVVTPKKKQKKERTMSDREYRAYAKGKSWKNGWSNTFSRSIPISGPLSIPSSLLWKLSVYKSPHSSNNKISFASIWRKEFTP